MTYTSQPARRNASRVKNGKSSAPAIRAIFLSDFFIFFFFFQMVRINRAGIKFQFMLN